MTAADQDYAAEREALDAATIGGILHRSPRWVREEMRAGRIPTSFRVGAQRFVYRDRFDDYLAQISAS